MVAVFSSPSATARTILARCFFLLILSFFTHHVAAVSFSFDFSNTSTYRLQDLRFEGDAALNQKGDLVDLTCNSREPDKNYYCKGRMSYNHPVPFYDNGTGEVASFATTFTFGIHMLPNTTKKGDGMAFFLSAYPSTLPLESYSSVLGLTNSSNTSATGADRFIAVEFDTYDNPWDPTGASDHMGIDLSSITSVSTTRLPSDSLNTTMTATITFDNTTRTLEATLHFDDASQSHAAARVKTQLPDNLDALLPPEVAVGFSAATGGNTELHQVHSWSFNSSMASREKPTGANRVQPKQDQVLGIKGRHGGMLVTAGAVVGALVLGVVIWAIVAWRMSIRMRNSIGISQVKHIGYHNLATATKRFSRERLLGKGSFGEVYRGKLKDMEVAVKKIVKDSSEEIKESGQEFKDFRAELRAIEATRHTNVVKLEGWCCNISNFMFWWSHKQNTKLFLVYEFVPNGTLHEHLHPQPEPGKPEVVLTWAHRYKIAKGLGSAVRYLHYECNNQYILHRDIKPGNILLDNEFKAKLADFGLSRVAKDGNQTSVPTVRNIGTPDYMDPRGMKDGGVILRRSSDVYSFGIVLLEIAHGENNLEHLRKLRTSETDENFVDAAADEKLAGLFVKTEMRRVLHVGLWCCEEEEGQRPTMIAAMRELDPTHASAELAPSQQPLS